MLHDFKRKPNRARQLISLASLFIIVPTQPNITTARAKTNEENAAHKSERHLSPDKKYAVEFFDGNDQQYGYIAISGVSRSLGRVSFRTIVRKNIYFRSSVDFRWVARQPHSLVYCAKLPTGKPYIAFWNGGSSIRILKVGKLPLSGVDPDAEYFKIVNIAADGKSLIYRHYDMTSKEKENDADRRFQRQYRLQLPSESTLAGISYSVRPISNRKPFNGLHYFYKLAPSYILGKNSNLALSVERSGHCSPARRERS